MSAEFQSKNRVKNTCKQTTTNTFIEATVPLSWDFVNYSFMHRLPGNIRIQPANSNSSNNTGNCATDTPIRLLNSSNSTASSPICRHNSIAASETGGVQVVFSSVFWDEDPLVFCLFDCDLTSCFNTFSVPKGFIGSAVGQLLPFVCSSIPSIGRFSDVCTSSISQARLSATSAPQQTICAFKDRIKRLVPSALRSPIRPGTAITSRL